MVLYMMYKNAKKVPEIENQVIPVENLKKLDPELKDHIIDVLTLSTIVCSEMIPAVVPHLVTETEVKPEENKIAAEHETI